MSFTLANVFSRAFSSLGKGFLPLLAVTVLLYILPNLCLVQGLRLAMGFTLGTPQAFQGGHIGISSAVMLLTYFFTFMHMGATYEICVLTQAGKPVKLGEVLMHALANAFPIFVIYLLCALIWIFGSVLLFVPACIFGTWFSVVVPAYVTEKPGIFGAFSRSRALTKGHRWGVFGLWVLMVVIFYIVAMVIELPLIMPMLKTTMLAAAAGRQAAPPTLPFVWMAVISVVFSALWVVILSINASVYSCLRAEKERFSSATVEKIFE